MKKIKENHQNILKYLYEKPKIDIISFSCADVITTSGFGDENQGEWDPQYANEIDFTA